MLDYLLRNILLYIFQNIETYKVFSNLKENWTEMSWNTVQNKLQKRSSWTTYRLKTHDVVLKNIVNNCANNISSIEKLTNSECPKAILVRGATGVGKTTYIKDKLDITDQVVVGPDLVRAMLKKAFFITAKKDSQYDLESYFVTDELIESLLHNKVSIIIERTIEYKEDLEKLYSLCLKNGYKSMHVVDLDASEMSCINRVLNRTRENTKCSPDVPEMYIEKCFKNVKASRNSIIEYILASDEIEVTYELLTNYSEGLHFNKIAEISNHKLVCLDSRLYNEVLFNSL